MSADSSAIESNSKAPTLVVRPSAAAPNIGAVHKENEVAHSTASVLTLSVAAAVGGGATNTDAADDFGVGFIAMLPATAKADRMPAEGVRLIPLIGRRDVGTAMGDLGVKEDSVVGG